MSDYHEAPTKPPEPAPEHKSQLMLKCPDCNHIYSDEDGITLYQCGECDTIFSQDNSADGCSHRCPDCNRFSSKLTENGCPECEEADGEEVMAHEDENGEWVEEEGVAVPAQDDPDTSPDDPPLSFYSRIPTMRLCGGCGKRFNPPVPKCDKCGWEAYRP